MVPEMLAVKKKATLGEVRLDIKFQLAWVQADNRMSKMAGMDI